MNAPVWDNRNKETLKRQLERRIREYAPAWNHAPDDTDAGAVIAQLFCEMFHQTIDRFNQVPEKLYLEFLNLLGVSEPPPAPAAGFVTFAAASAGSEAVRVPKGTKVFAKPEDDNIVFETDRTIEAVAAVLEDVYFVSTHDGVIERSSPAQDIVFFGSSGGENLYSHSFAVSQNEVLELGGKCKIIVDLRQKTSFLEDETKAVLSDPGQVRWSYWDGERLQDFDAVSLEDKRLSLRKDSPGRLMSEADGRIYVHCRALKDIGEIVLDGVSLQSAKEPSPADSLFSDDIKLDPAEGGLAFGRQPSPYGMFYIKSDEVFVKRGATAVLRLDVSTVEYSDINEELQYEFRRYLVNKKNAVKITPDDVRVSQVVWEYYNEFGWAALPVKGNINPFSGQSEGAKELTFIIPPDIAPTVHNAEEGFFIRARIVTIDNFLSMQPRFILPYVNSVSCSWQYPRDVPADYLRSRNNMMITEIAGAVAKNLDFAAITPLPSHPDSMYLRFDRAFRAMPLSILFDISTEAALPCKFACEAFIGGKFVRLSAIDSTRNLRHTGTICLYIPEELSTAEFFGESGYWVRFSLSSSIAGKAEFPVVSGMHPNTVYAGQRQVAPCQRFDTETYAANKSAILSYAPVQTCELWVDEALEISAEELSWLGKKAPERLAIERDGARILRAWVKWEQIPALWLAKGDERVYELDVHSGKITFGDGTKGKVPPRGAQNIKVDYSYGGGLAGNLRPGEVNALLGSIPLITGVTNIMPMGGGTDKLSLEKLKRLGNKRLRHRYIPVSPADFEEIILERFLRVTSVKCFPGMNEEGEKAPGHVCIVVMSEYIDDMTLSHDLCLRIFDYLSERADGNLVASGRLHVIPSIRMTVSVEAQVTLRDLELAAETQQEIDAGISTLIEKVWRTRDIGEQIDVGEIYALVKSNRNVAAINRILPEGRYEKGGRERLVPLHENSAFPFATARNGQHTVRVV